MQAKVVLRLSTGSLNPLHQLDKASIETQLGGHLVESGVGIIQNVNTSINNLLSNVSPSDIKHIVNGMYDTYKCVYVYNNALNEGEGLTRPHLYINSQDSIAGFEVGVLPKNEMAQVISSSEEVPAGIVFHKPTKEAPLELVDPHLQIPRLNPGDFFAVWIRRRVDVQDLYDGHSNSIDGFSIHVGGLS